MLLGAFSQHKIRSVDAPPLGRTPIERDLDRLREQLVVLALECPYTESNPPSCPLHNVRKMEPAAIIDWLDGLDGEEKHFLLLYRQCSPMAKWERDALDGGQRKRAIIAGAKVGLRKGSKGQGLRSRQQTKRRLDTSMAPT